MRKKDANAMRREQAPVRRVALITPLWNEEVTLPLLAKTVLEQTLSPVAWILVDDGSTDSTRDIALSLAATHSFISCVSSRPQASYGADIGAPAGAFNVGLSELRRSGVAFDVVMKIDADLLLDAGFVEAISTRFSEQQELGVAAARMFIADGETVRLDKPGGRHTRGATKAYSRRCIEAIGGLQVCLGWDTIDEITAELRGFAVATIEEARATQMRPMGSTTGICRGRVRAGRAAYLLGYPAWAIGFRAARRILERPRLLGSACLLYGYARSRVRREPLSAPPEVVLRLRATQKQRVAQAFRYLGRSARSAREREEQWA
jgi:poly-beta-1,6-N-acetyl-D-glucosamine synthase